MGKLKGFFWFLIIAFVIYSLIVWFVKEPTKASEAATGVMGWIVSAKDALGIFFSELTK